jgi:hypothetical protein
VSTNFCLHTLVPELWNPQCGFDPDVKLSQKKDFKKRNKMKQFMVFSISIYNLYRCTNLDEKNSFDTWCYFDYFTNFVLQYCIRLGAMAGAASKFLPAA